MQENKRIMEKIIKKYRDKLTMAYNVGFVSESFPVNCFFQTDDGLRFYVSFDKNDGWQVDYTRELSIRMRSQMPSIRDIKNQTETFKVIDAIINKMPFTITLDRRCIVETTE